MAIDSKAVQGGAASSKGLTTKPTEKMASANPEQPQQAVNTTVSSQPVLVTSGSNSSGTYDYNQYGIPQENTSDNKYIIWALIGLILLFIFKRNN